MGQIRVLIADDHAVLREGVRLLLETQSDMTVVGEAGDGIEALEQTRKLKPDVILLDIAMPRMSGLEAVGMIREAAPDSRVVVLSMYEKEAYAHQVLEAGAYGYVLKGEPGSDLLTAIRSAYSGRYYFSKKLHLEVIQGYLKCRTRETGNESFESLSEREKQVFFLLLEGNSSLQIGKVLFLSTKTVEKHRASICKKLGIKSPVEMMKFAICHGIVDPDFWKN